VIFPAVFPPELNRNRCSKWAAAGTALFLSTLLIAVPGAAGAADARGGDEARLKQLRGRIEALQEKLN